LPQTHARRSTSEMSTSAQIVANRANAEWSTGPRTDEGKAASSRNRVSHGLTGEFRVLPSELQSEYDALLAAFREEHQPTTPTETALVEGLAQHQWLRKRALRLESSCFDVVTGQIDDEKRLALCLRYQSTHERGFHKCLNALLKLRAEKRKAKIGFECGTCKIRVIGSGQVGFGASFGEADRALGCETAA
jgi:hypothetical protein